MHRRSYNHDDADLEYDTRSTGRAILPLEASGEYSMGSGGTVDVELQPDRLSGFITRSGDRESDEGTPLTFFFATSRLAGQHWPLPRGRFTACGCLLKEPLFVALPEAGSSRDTTCSRAGW